MAITSWTSEGMDWANPDPAQGKYWEAVVLAVNERRRAAGLTSGFLNYGDLQGSNRILDRTILHAVLNQCLALCTFYINISRDYSLRENAIISNKRWTVDDYLAELGLPRNTSEHYTVPAKYAVAFQDKYKEDLQMAYKAINLLKVLPHANLIHREVKPKEAKALHTAGWVTIHGQNSFWWHVSVPGDPSYFEDLGTPSSPDYWPAGMPSGDVWDITHDRWSNNAASREIGLPSYTDIWAGDGSIKTDIMVSEHQIDYNMYSSMGDNNQPLDRIQQNWFNFTHNFITDPLWTSEQLSLFTRVRACVWKTGYSEKLLEARWTQTSQGGSPLWAYRHTDVFEDNSVILAALLELDYVADKDTTILGALSTPATPDMRLHVTGGGTDIIDPSQLFKSRGSQFVKTTYSYTWQLTYLYDELTWYNFDFRDWSVSGSA